MVTQQWCSPETWDHRRPSSIHIFNLYFQQSRIISPRRSQCYSRWSVHLECYPAASFFFLSHHLSCCLRHPGKIAGICIVESGSLCFPWVLFLPSHLLFLLLCSHFLLHLISCIVCTYQPLLFCRLCRAYRPSLIPDGRVSLYCGLEGSHCMPSPLNFPFPRVSTPIIVSTLCSTIRISIWLSTF